MPIVTNPEGRKLYVRRRVSNSTVEEKFVLYPNAIDDATIVNQDPDIEFLAIDRDVRPVFDSRTHTLITAEAKVGNLWHITFTTQRRPNAEIKAAIRARERAEITTHLSDIERDKFNLICNAINFKLNAGQALNAFETNIRSRANTLYQKLVTNHQNADALEAQVDANQVPNIDSGWASA